MGKNGHFGYQKKAIHLYTRPNENEIAMFEEHLANVILERTKSMGATKWTVTLLKKIAEQERMRPEFENLESLKKYEFSSRYWNRFISRKQRFSKFLIFESFGQYRIDFF